MKLKIYLCGRIYLIYHGGFFNIDTVMGLKVLSETSPSKIKKIVAVAAGKGGVGKSTLTASLALASALSGLRVGVLDADVYGPSIPLLLPDTTPVSTKDGWIVPAYSGNIRTLSITHFGITENGAAFRAPVVNMFIQPCVRQVAWGELDILYVDFPPGVGDVHLCLLQELAFHGVVLVTMPNRLSQSDVEKAADSFQELEVPVLALVENFANSTVFGIQNSGALQERYQPLLVEKISLDPDYTAVLNQGENPFLRSRLSVMAQELIAMEGRIRELEPKEFLKEYRLEQELVEVLYEDGVSCRLPINLIQQHCPCKRCSGKVADQKHEATSVQATKVESIGRYGLKFTFLSGCSQGIYSHKLLRGLVCAE